MRETTFYTNEKTNKKGEKMKKFCVVIIFIVLSYQSYSQKQFNNWYFGDSAAITFNYGSPAKSLVNSKMKADYSASISNRYGNLLFYTDGYKIWDSTDLIDSIYSNKTGGNFPLIIPITADTNKFCIISIDDSGYNYSIFNRNSKKFEKKNILFLHNYIQINLITSVRHKNNKDFWIIVPLDYRDSIYSFLLTENGINKNPIINKIDKINGGTWGGLIKSSIIGNVLAYNYIQAIYLYKFDNSTGKIEYLSVIDMPSNIYNHKEMIKDIEFSPNGKFLYVSQSGNNKNYLVQYDLNVIPPKAYIIDSTIAPECEGLQLGPDFKMYSSIMNQNFLYIVKKPNNSGVGCGLTKNDLFLDHGRCKKYFNNYIPQVYLDVFIKLGHNHPDCSNDTLRLFTNISTLSTHYHIKWTGPNGFISSEENPIISSLDTVKGYYYFTYLDTLKEVNDSIILIKDSIWLDIPTRPIGKINSINRLDVPKLFCESYSNDTSIVVYNIGKCKLTFTGMYIGGNDSTEFSIIEPKNYPIYLDPNDSLKVVVRFSPNKIKGRKTATLSIDNNTPITPWNINLSAIYGIEYIINNSDSDTIVIDLGTICPVGKDTTITIINKSSIGTTFHIENKDSKIQIKHEGKAGKKEGTIPLTNKKRKK
jgi:hypothetical protein